LLFVAVLGFFTLPGVAYQKRPPLAAFEFEQVDLFKQAAEVFIAVVAAIE